MKKTHIGKIAAFFLYSFGSIILPTAGILIVAYVFMPRPYLADSSALAVVDGRFADLRAVFGKDAEECNDDSRDEFENVAAAAWCSFPDDSRAIAIASPDEKKDGARSKISAGPHAYIHHGHDSVGNPLQEGRQPEARLHHHGWKLSHRY